MDNLGLSTDYNTMINNAVKAGVEYVTENKIKALVLGVSGGVDSAVTAGIAGRVCRAAAEVGHEVRLIGCCMPIDGNKPDETARAVAVGIRYCHDFKVTELDDAFYNMMRAVDNDLYHKYVNDKANLCQAGKIRAGNIKARVRMINLYNMAHKNGGLVLSTDNLTEYYLGFWSIAGDIGDLSLIQMLWKTEVFGMADVFGDEVGVCASAVPTDGLGVTNSDIDQVLPNWTPEMGNYRDAYRHVDDILIDYIFSAQKSYSPEHPVIHRHLATGFKRKSPIVIGRDYLLWKHA